IHFEKKDKHGMNGAIILMHLGTKRKFDKLFYVLPEFISEMKKKGYSFVTVSEVLNDKQD
ncbi:MAG: polysaccharide deacetylase family protein, partial [Leptospiraceae bacterium]|nr:polysaccharide deacetylase family protein [Leptospiraceae bacterium]